MNLKDKDTRIQVLAEIQSEENHARKREQQKRFDIYRERQDRYIIERLEREFSPDTVKHMRKILSINLSTKIVDDLSSIYNTPPERTFVNDPELNENQLEQCQNLYEFTQFNQAMRRANRFYNLHDQCALMIVPDKMGSLKVRALPPMHYDVVPSEQDPEVAEYFILNVWNHDLYKTTSGYENESTQLSRYRQNDQQNQKIAEENDKKALMDRYIVWHKEYHFVMDGKGNLVSELMPNPIGRLPFVDVAKEKDFQYFVRRGTSVTDFALDVGLLLSDLANIIRLQGYAQAVISSEKEPVNFVVGPNNLLWLKIDAARPDIKPSFEFVSPTPDISGSMSFLENTIKLFMASRGIDSGAITGSGKKQFSSGLERLLYMLDKFEATKADFDLFENVEMEAFQILKAWSNAFQGVTDEPLRPELRRAEIPESAYVDLKFAEPTVVETKADKEERLYKRMEQSLLSKKQFLMKVDGLSEEAAEQQLSEVDKEDGSTESFETENQPDN